MSHIVNIKTEIKDQQAVSMACTRLKIAQPTMGNFQVFSKQCSGLGVRLNDWNYPVVCDLNTGELQYDNYNGHWGAQARLDEFLQAYAVEKTHLEAAKNGYSVFEETLADGTIKLVVDMGA